MLILLWKKLSKEKLNIFDKEKYLQMIFIWLLCEKGVCVFLNVICLKYEINVILFQFDFMIFFKLYLKKKDYGLKFERKVKVI